MAPIIVAPIKVPITIPATELDFNLVSASVEAESRLLGLLDGCTVGVAVGAPGVGTVVGCATVGVDDGPVGASVGTAVGPVGACVGVDVVGASVGTAIVGASVGTTEIGASVGVNVVGVNVGGVTVGMAVGAGVSIPAVTDHIELL